MTPLLAGTTCSTGGHFNYAPVKLEFLGWGRRMSVAVSSPMAPLNFMDKLQAAEQRDASRGVGRGLRSNSAPSYRQSVANQPSTEGTLLPHGFNSRGQAVNGQTRQHIQQQKRVNAAAQRRGKASDPSKSLAPLGYAVLGPIAAGAFSTILRCKAKAGSGQHIRAGLIVAIKSYDNIKCATDVDEADARNREFSVLRRLKDAAHPHIANMLAELGDKDMAHCHAVLEYCEGGTLKRYLETPGLLHPGARDDEAREGMMPPLVAVATRQLAQALHHIHRLGICHRDIKPANILLSSVANVTPSTLHLRICDFGFACICFDELQTQYFGTPQYAAPEIASAADAHRGYLGRPVDAWALGCVIFEMLYLTPAFKAEERFELEGLIRNCNFGRSESVESRKRVPPKARALIKALLAPVDRRLSAEQVLSSEWITTFGVAKSQAELQALQAIPSWWCDVAGKGCKRPKDGAYPPHHVCWKNGDYMVCEVCYESGKGVREKRKLQRVPNPLATSNATPPPAGAFGLGDDLGDHGQRRSQSTHARSAGLPMTSAPLVEAPSSLATASAVQVGSRQADDDAAKRKMAAAKPEVAAAPEAAAQTHLQAETDAPEMEEQTAAEVLMAERQAAMEHELERLKAKHACSSRLEACLRELDDERRRTTQLRVKITQLRADMALQVGSSSDAVPGCGGELQSS